MTATKTPAAAQDYRRNQTFDFIDTNELESVIKTSARDHKTTKKNEKKKKAKKQNYPKTRKGFAIRSSWIVGLQKDRTFKTRDSQGEGKRWRERAASWTASGCLFNSDCLRKKWRGGMVISDGWTVGVFFLKMTFDGLMEDQSRPMWWLGLEFFLKIELKSFWTKTIVEAKQRNGMLSLDIGEWQFKGRTKVALCHKGWRNFLGKKYIYK